MSTAVPLPDVRRALVVTAHPDDADFGAAGTVATWTAAGIEVFSRVRTTDAASGDGALDRTETARVRHTDLPAEAGPHAIGELLATRDLRPWFQVVDPC